MSLSACPKCWDTPCTCGYKYTHLSREQREELAAVVLGVNPADIVNSDLLVPEVHPMKENNSDAS